MRILEPLTKTAAFVASYGRAYRLPLVLTLPTLILAAARADPGALLAIALLIGLTLYEHGRQAATTLTPVRQNANEATSSQGDGYGSR
jgi:hypothetical protein